MVIIPNLYLKNLYFKSLRWFCRCIPLIHDLINIFTLKPSIFNKKFNFLEKQPISWCNFNSTRRIYYD
ncbi:orotate phosphoribosyltransferase [Helicobacter pylori]|nr:orotate phosphoribosyltransferase [Helicobacter pylori]